MRNLFVICTIALIFGVNSARVGICQFKSDDFINGDVTFTETVNADQQIVVQVSGTITAPSDITGDHGFHIHQFGDLRDNIGSAGSHFNPYNKLHNCTAPSHLGDLGNIKFTPGAGADDDSTAILASTLSIIDGELYSDITLIGRTLVIHQNEDDCTQTQDFGERIAQCVIGYKEGNVGYYTPSADKTTPQAICVLEDMELQIIFEQGVTVGFINATINITNYENDIYLSLTESVDTLQFNDANSKQLFNAMATKPLPTTVTVDGLSIRKSAEDIVNIIGKAVYCVDGDDVQHSCVIGFYNSAYPPATTTATATSSSTSATTDPTTGSSTSTGDVTTGDATSTTTGAANASTTTTGDLTGNATSTTGSTTMTNMTTDASSTSGQAINPALNTTDTSGGAVLGIIFATFILLGLAWYTYVNRGNNQRRIGYFGV